MKTLTSILSEASGKMAALYKRNPADTSPLSLIKGLKFYCDALGYTINGDTVEFFDMQDSSKARFSLDISCLMVVHRKRKDKYGAIAAWLYVEEDQYLLQFA